MSENTQAKPRFGCIKMVGLAALVFFALLVIWTCLAYRKSPQASQPLFKPTVAASFVTEPLDENGDVDYIEYINRDSARGVTRENNAVVKLVEALGAQPELDDTPAEFFQRLETSPPFDRAEAFAEFDSWYRDSDLVDDDRDSDFLSKYGDAFDTLQFEFGRSYPFSRQQLPELAAYLDSQQRALDLVGEAVQCSRYYYPKILPKHGKVMVEVPLTHCQGFRTLTRALVCRSNLRLGQQDVEGAIDDAMAVLKLGNLMSDTDTFVELLVATAIRSIGHNQLARIVRHPDVTFEDLGKIEQAVGQLTDLTSYERVFSQRERLVALDTVKVIFRNDSDEFLAPGFDSFMGFSGVLSICNAESAMEEVNRLFDEVLALHKKGKSDPNFNFARAQEDLMVSYQKEFGGMGANIKLLFGSRRRRGQQVGKLFALMLMPAMIEIERSQARVNSELRMLKLQIALQRYQKSKGEYPESLALLVSEFIPEIPADPLSRGRDYVYEVESESYRLYSIGADQVDNGRSEDSLPAGYRRVDQDWWLDVEPPVSWAEYLEQRKVEPVP